MQTKRNQRDTRSFSDKLADTTGMPRFTPRRPRSRSEAPRRERKSSELFQLRDKREIGRDGVDHINCTNMGSTPLGTALSTQTRTPLKHQCAGPFRTMEGFMWYLRTENDMYRSLSGHIANVTGQKLRSDEKKPIPNELFQLLVADAYWQFISGNEELAKQVAASELPFDMYNIDRSGIRIRIQNATWLVHILEIIRQTLNKELSYPHFFKLFAPDSVYGSERGLRGIEEVISTEEQKDEAISLIYGGFVANVIKKHFKGLIDFEKVQENQLRNSQRSAKKAAHQILNETAKDLAEFARAVNQAELQEHPESRPEAADLYGDPPAPSALNVYTQAAQLIPAETEVVVEENVMDSKSE